MIAVIAIVTTVVVVVSGHDSTVATQESTDGPAATTTTPRTSTPRSTERSTASPTPSPDDQPVEVAALPGYLLTAEDASTVMATPGMVAEPVAQTLVRSANQLTPDCTSVFAVTDQGVFGPSGYTGSVRQTVRTEPKSNIAMAQAIVAFADDAKATAVYNQIVAAWGTCRSQDFDEVIAGKPVHFKPGVVGNTDGTATLLLFSRGQLDSPATTTDPNCERAVTARKNVLVDVLACSPKLGSEGFTVARDIGQKITGTR